MVAGSQYFAMDRGLTAFSFDWLYSSLIHFRYAVGRKCKWTRCTNRMATANFIFYLYDLGCYVGFASDKAAKIEIKRWYLILKIEN